MADSKLMNAVGTCDGTNYQDHRANLVEYCVLEDIEHVLHTPCPAPITATLAAGVWGDDEHPCGDEDPRKGTTAPQRTVNQRNADIAAHKKADKRLKALPTRIIFDRLGQRAAVVGSCPLRVQQHRAAVTEGLCLGLGAP